MEDIFEGSLFEAQMIKNQLENEGISAFLGNEIIGSGGFLFGPAVGVRVFVGKENVQKARSIVDEYIHNNATGY